MYRYEPTDDEVKQAIKDTGNLEVNDAVFVLRAFAKAQFPEPTVWVRDVMANGTKYVCYSFDEVAAVVRGALDQLDAGLYIGISPQYELPIDETSGGR